jgi:hypothetical protein
MCLWFEVLFLAFFFTKTVFVIDVIEYNIFFEF